jgi:hypothetical protein
VTQSRRPKAADQTEFVLTESGANLIAPSPAAATEPAASPTRRRALAFSLFGYAALAAGCGGSSADPAPSAAPTPPPGATPVPAPPAPTPSPSPPPANALADWQARSTATGVFFKENFDYSTLGAASARSPSSHFYAASQLNGGSPDPSIYSINAGGLSAKYLRINYPPNSGTSGYSWHYTFDDNPVGYGWVGIAHDNFYFQVIVRGDRAFDFPFKTSGDEMASPKLLVIDGHDRTSTQGEVVLTNDHMRGFVASYVGFTPSHGSQLIQTGIMTPQGSPDFRNQPGIDAGVPSSPSSMADFRRRYGPMNSDVPNIPLSSITGSSSLAAAGWPNAESAQAGVIWARNQWIVITFHIHGAGNRVRFWASKYGESPKLLGDTAAWSLGALNMGRGSTGYPGFQLTPFITGNTNAAGANQPVTWIDYAEIIASNNPIAHPGGFTLPGT